MTPLLVAARVGNVDSVNRAIADLENAELKLSSQLEKKSHRKIDDMSESLSEYLSSPGPAGEIESKLQHYTPAWLPLCLC